MGCIWRPEKRCFYVSNISPNSWNCRPCSNSMKKRKDFMHSWFEIFLLGFVFIKLNKMGVIHNHPIMINLNQYIIYIYDSTYQLLNNLLETQDNQSEMSQNSPLFRGVLSAEEHVLDSFRSWTGTKNNFSSINDQYQWIEWKNSIHYLN